MGVEVNTRLYVGIARPVDNDFDEETALEADCDWESEFSELSFAVVGDFMLNQNIMGIAYAKRLLTNNNNDSGILWEHKPHVELTPLEKTQLKKFANLFNFPKDDADLLLTMTIG